MLLRRLRLQLPLVPAFCPCRRRLDALGDHRASCPRSGLLRSRAVPLERAAARVCREAGATVATNVLLRDLNLVVQRQDERRIEVIANGLPLWSGAQLAVDTTLVSALDSAGQARRHQRSTAGAALRIARKAKERTYPELLRSARCRLVVLGIELGGRWSTEAAQFIRLLARSRARAAPPLLRSSATAAYVTRWSALLSFAAARALAASLLSLPLAHTANVDGDPLDLSDLLGAAHEALPPSLPSRLPPDFVQLRRLTRDAGLTSGRELKQGSRVGSHRSNSKHAGPPVYPDYTRRGGFSAEAAANLNDPEYDKPRTSGALELAVGLAPFASGCVLHSDPIVPGYLCSGLAGDASNSMLQRQGEPEAREQQHTEELFGFGRACEQCGEGVLPGLNSSIMLTSTLGSGVRRKHAEERGYGGKFKFMPAPD
ncbi:hypothetical protein AK812_SmicGene43688 [Symbiodinium microadriaticum]|uniref:Uncharacterized protein n=1 Tax=Symbiodinium microadriaticum TaxID=2951 RepID=A0A1Q9C0D3_SYMMI|nr:hypothetical protein AK812_SmicGene43688 [Symbiodinium microadriaticum]